MSEVISTMEKKICKHEETCGKDMLVTIRNFDLKLQKIELRQVKMDVKMNMTASLVSKIADKMKITIDLKDINNNSEED